MDDSESTKLREHIIGEYIPDDVKIDDDSSLFSTRIITSRNLMHLVNFVEKTYSIRVSPMELVLENFDSIAKLVAYIDRKRAG